ncbi:MAG: double zinc ribbon domain-containing protein [Clostridiales bacterium]|jgi:predicted amidophosphoribosyltransferase|nr:double zinc ribbon domain-containing protein [Clostridiales bacterium]
MAAVTVREKFKKLKSKFLFGLFPTDAVCLVCGEELKSDRRFSLCGECVSALPYISDEYNICEKCGKPFFDEARFCLECQNHRKAFERANSPFIYEGAAAKLVEQLKFNNKQYYAKPMGGFVAAEYVRRDYSADALIPVPMFKEAEKIRGFNQSRLIGEAAAEILGIEMIADVLIKTRETKHQIGLTAYERRKNLEGAFGIAEYAPAPANNASNTNVNPDKNTSNPDKNTYQNTVNIDKNTSNPDKNTYQNASNTDKNTSNINKITGSDAPKNENIEKIKGKRILLIDDVITTGSTINECAKVLLGAGAKSVCAIAFCGTKYRLPRGDMLKEPEKDEKNDRK